MWSFEPATTLKDSITLIGSALFGLYLASRYTIKQQLQLLAWVFGIAIILSFIFAIALPKFGIMGGVHQGKWRGVFLHKNVLGARMVISALIFFLLGNEAKKYRSTIWCGFCLSVLLMLLSASSSSLLNLLILIFAFFVFLIWRWPYPLMIPALIAIVTGGECLYLLFINSGDAIFNSIGKDATLTGRTELWPLVMEMIWKHPWLGYGFSGFWQGLDGESAYIWRAAGWTPTHPHNGFLALWLDLGLLGLSVFFLGFWRNLVQAVVWLRLSKTMSSIWPILYLLYVVISNLTESGLIEANRLNFVLYTAISFSLLIQLDAKQKYSPDAAKL
jgi:O-antigen ligase